MKRFFVWTLTFLLTFPTVLPAQDTKIYPSRTTLPFLNVATYIQFPGGARLTDGSGTLTLAGGQLLIPKGTAALPAIADAAQTTTGWFYPVSPTLAIQFGRNGGNSGPLISANVTIEADGQFAWSNTSGDSTATTDTFLKRAAAATVQQGIDGASPVNQVFKGPDGSGADKAAGTLTIANGKPTGTGAPGQICFQVASTGAASSSSLQSTVSQFCVSEYGSILTSRTFGTLGAPANGTITFCSDCDAPTLVDSTCTSAGAKTGSFAVRVNSAWKCIS